MTRSRIAHSLVSFAIAAASLVFVSGPVSASKPIQLCAASALQFTLGPVIGKTGHQSSVDIGLQNMGARSCALAGYADVALDLKSDNGSHCHMPRGTGWGGIHRIVLRPRERAAITVVFLPGDKPGAIDENSDLPTSVSTRLPGETQWTSLPWTPRVVIDTGHRCGGPTHSGTYASPIHSPGKQR
jgi:Protein of unknown function (DUF4232)